MSRGRAPVLRTAWRPTSRVTAARRRDQFGRATPGRPPSTRRPLDRKFDHGQFHRLETRGVDARRAAGRARVELVFTDVQYRGGPRATTSRVCATAPCRPADVAVPRQPGPSPHPAARRPLRQETVTLRPHPPGGHAPTPCAGPCPRTSSSRPYRQGAATAVNTAHFFDHPLDHVPAAPC